MRAFLTLTSLLLCLATRLEADTNDFEILSRQEKDREYGRLYTVYMVLLPEYRITFEPVAGWRMSTIASQRRVTFYRTNPRSMAGFELLNSPEAVSLIRKPENQQLEFFQKDMGDAAPGFRIETQEEIYVNGKKCVLFNIIYQSKASIPNRIVMGFLPFEGGVIRFSSQSTEEEYARTKTVLAGLIKSFSFEKRVI